ERAVVRDRGTDEPEPRPGAADDPPPDRWPPAAGDRRPPEEMPVDRPAAVEVQGVAVAIAGPAIAGVAGEHRIDRGVDRRPVNPAGARTSASSPGRPWARRTSRLSIGKSTQWSGQTSRPSTWAIQSRTRPKAFGPSASRAARTRGPPSQSAVDTSAASTIRWSRSPIGPHQAGW